MPPAGFRLTDLGEVRYRLGLSIGPPGYSMNTLRLFSPRRWLRFSRSLAHRFSDTVAAAQHRRGWHQHGEKWAVSRVDVQGCDVAFSGWAIVPNDPRSRVAITCNGKVVENTRYPIDRPDVAQTYPDVPGAFQSGFDCSHQMSVPCEPGQVLEFNCFDKATGRPLGPNYHPHFYRLAKPDDPPLPAANRRVRVINIDADDYFLDSGFLQYARLQRALERAAGKTFGDCQRILDWGCGCGRVSRYFRDRPAGSFAGADVDGENVDWCRRNLPSGDFHVLPLHPRSDLGAGSFDLVFGISVFTHLREADQFEWLAELHRITRPGAHLLLTVHGDTTVYRHRTNFNPSQLAERMRAGFLVTSNHQYDAVLSESDYYCETYHTEPYLRKTWGRYFKILDIVPGYIGPQDLVVLRRE